MGGKINYLNRKLNVTTGDVNIGDVGLVDENENPITSSNPLPTNVISSSGDLTITNVINETNYDLNASSFNETTNISNDFILDNIEFNFSTTESKTITITSYDGTIIYKDTNSNSNLVLSDIDLSFDGNNNFTINITQTVGTCLADIKAKIKQGGTGLVGNPVLGAGNEIIGKVQLVTENGDYVTDNDSKCVNVCVQNQTTEPIELFLCRDLNSVTLASNMTIDSRTLTLVAGHGVVVGNMICLKEDKHFAQVLVTAVNTNTITIDTPIDYAFTTNAIARRTTNSLKVDGSSTTQIYRVSPVNLNNVKWHIQRLRFFLTGTGELKAEDFASITNGLTNGIVLRRKNGTLKNVGNVKTNAGFSRRCETFYEDKPLYSLRCVKHIEEDFGVVIELNSEDADELQIIVQDNLNVVGIGTFQIIAQGHVTKD